MFQSSRLVALGLCAALVLVGGSIILSGLSPNLSSPMAAAARASSSALVALPGGRMIEVPHMTKDYRDVKVCSRQRKWEIREHMRDPIKMGLMGTKAGMTTYYDDEGIAHPVTVIALEAGNVVTQVKTKETDGYDAVQLAYKETRDRTIPWPERQHLRKHGNVKAMKHLKEFKIADVSEFTPGQQLKAEELFEVGDLVDVSGTSSGKGFQGSIRRWGMKRGPMSHGSKSHRQHGSIGCSATPSRVYKGLKMAGRMGNERKTVKKLPVMMVNDEEKYIVVRGSVPGKKGTIVELRPTKIVGKHC
uniref:Large ribosomal subunit protein uL3c n=1 Tax=Bigelowiella natans TaxID=227086 RepID=RK3_BIGNA|nr:RecName: Full=Large ribosomal subunit protein uL3c; AltName: Full=50S ribosomal protein L3, chloroplastic; Flags: Precursor [Bigelowiella natans]AAP79150.1 ribosomal protein rpL3 [Bigelowiella natans]